MADNPTLGSFFPNDRTWEDRIRQAAYTSPSGVRITFDYEDVSRETDKATTAFEIPGINNDYIQDNGFGSRKYPLRCFFTGRSCDLEATAFENALLERGVGKLDHPLYGPRVEMLRGRGIWNPVSVVPFGTITRRDDLKSAANQSVVEVTFWTTTGAIYPSAQGEPRNEILAALDRFDLAEAQQFANSTKLARTIDKANAKASVRKFLKDVSAAIGKVSSGVTAVNREFRDLQQTINLGLDVLIGQPLLLAQQISNLIKAPGRALSGIQSRLDAYGVLADSIFGSSAANPADILIGSSVLGLRTTKITNDFHVAQQFATSTVSGAVGAVSFEREQFKTKPEALEAAAKIVAMFDALVANRDTGFAALQTIDSIEPGYIDTGEAYQALHEAVALTVGFLIEISFSLIPERAVVLDRNRTIIDVCAELYGEVDAKLDFLIETNQLTGSEILELPKGRLVKFYKAAA